MLLLSPTPITFVAPAEPAQQAARYGAFSFTLADGDDSDILGIGKAPTAHDDAAAAGADIID